MIRNALCEEYVFLKMKRTLTEKFLVGGKKEWLSWKFLYCLEMQHGSQLLFNKDEQLRIMC